MDLLTATLTDVEILMPGTWHGTGCPPVGCKFTTKDLDEIARAYHATHDQLRPPLKLGHNDEQTLVQSDGLPAAGWVSNVRVLGEKLLCDLVSVPKKIAALMEAGAYRTRSVELEGDYEVAGKRYPLMLTGLALLGADLPAVEGLDDIANWYAKAHLPMPKKVAVFRSERAAPHAINFTLPDGQSYYDVQESIQEAIRERFPASDYQPWIADLFEDTTIFCDGEARYWRIGYSLDADGNATLTDTPAQVERVTTWETVGPALSRDREAAARHTSFADNAERVLADTSAFVARAGELAALRGKDGRALSKAHQSRLRALHDNASEIIGRIDALLDEAPPKNPDAEPSDRLMHARLRLAALNGSELASTGA